MKKPQTVNKIKISRLAMGNTHLQLILTTRPDCQVQFSHFRTAAKDGLHGLSDLLF